MTQEGNPTTMTTPQRGLVLADRARQHLQTLVPPHSLRALEARSGVSYSSLHRIYNGTYRNCTPTVEEAILGVRTIRPYWVPSLGVARRLQALCCRGWDSRSVAAQHGADTRTIRQWRVQFTPAVQLVTHEDIDTLYQKLWDVDGPSRTAAIFARRYGYQPPEAWTDETIDDPQARPYQWTVDDWDAVLVDLALSSPREYPIGGLNPREQIEMYKRYIDGGGTEHGFRRLYAPPLHVMPKILEALGDESIRSRRRRLFLEKQSLLKESA